MRLSIRPPKTWTNHSQSDFLAFAEAGSDGGLRPRLNVVSMKRGSLSAEDFVELLRGEQNGSLADFELLSEGPTLVGERRAFEITGRCSYESQSAVVRQILVLIDDRIWLFSAFAPEGAASVSNVDDTMALVDSVLETVKFFPAEEPFEDEPFEEAESSGAAPFDDWPADE